MEARIQARARSRQGTWHGLWQGTTDVWHAGRGEEFPDVGDKPKNVESTGVPEVGQVMSQLVFGMNKVMSHICRPTGGSVARLTRLISFCIDKLTFSWRFKLDELSLKPTLLVDAHSMSDESTRKI